MIIGSFPETIPLFFKPEKHPDFSRDIKFDCTEGKFSYCSNFHDYETDSDQMTVIYNGRQLPYPHHTFKIGRQLIEIGYSSLITAERYEITANRIVLKSNKNLCVPPICQSW